MDGVSKVGGPVYFRDIRPEISNDQLQSEIDNIVSNNKRADIPQKLAQLFGDYSLTTEQKDKVRSIARDYAGKQQNLKPSKVSGFESFCVDPMVTVPFTNIKLTGAETFGYGVAAAALTVAGAAYAWGIYADYAAVAGCNSFVGIAGGGAAAGAETAAVVVEGGAVAGGAGLSVGFPSLACWGTGGVLVELLYLGSGWDGCGGPIGLWNAIRNSAAGRGTP